jgi:hypothetical protein
MPIAAAGAYIKSTDIVDTASVVIVDTTIGTPAVNFTLNSGTARTLLNGKLVNLTLSIKSTNAITSTSGNVTDTLMFTLDAPYRPTETITAGWGNGTTEGECIISATGNITLRSAAYTIAAASNIAINVTFIRE